MKELMVLMTTHSTLHEGHRQLFNYGKSFGDVTAVVYIDMATMWRYLSSGVKEAPRNYMNLNKLRKDLNDIGVNSEFKSALNIEILDDKLRSKLYQEGYNLAIQYKDLLLSDRYNDAIARRYMTSKLPELSKDPNIAFLCGPEIPYFFRRKFSNYFPDREIYIMPKMVQDPNLGIRYQAVTERLLPYYSYDISRIKYMVDGARSFFRPGTNGILLKELQEAYSTRSWKLKEILVYEGEFVDGHLEIVIFSFPNPSGQGTSLLESSMYEKA